MNRKLIAIAVVGCLSGAFGCVDAQAQQNQPQARSPLSGPPLRVPLGTLPREVLAAKVVVTDMQKSFDFYTRVIGLKPARATGQKEAIPPAGSDNSKWPGEYGFTFSGLYDEAFFDILRPRPGTMPTPASTSLVQLVFKVPDASRVISHAKELGYTVEREAPVVKPGEMSIGMLRDPDGYRVEIIQAASYPARK